MACAAWWAGAKSCAGPLTGAVPALRHTAAVQPPGARQWVPTRMHTRVRPATAPARPPAPSSPVLHATARSAQAIAGLLLAKLSQDNPKVAHLAVGVAESLAKNGTAAVHVALAESGTATALGSLARKHPGRPLGDAAATLLQELAVAYAAAAGPPLISFSRAHRAASADGVRFPPAPRAGSSAGVQPLAMTADATAGAVAGGGAGATRSPPARAGTHAGAVGSGSASAVSYPAAPRADPGAASVEAAQEALLDQLGTVQEWAAESAALLHEAGGEPGRVRASAQGRFLDLVDLLSQCPARLNALIDAGLAGRLTDACLGAALEAQATLTELLPWLVGSSPADRAKLARFAAAGRAGGGASTAGGATAAGGAAGGSSATAAGAPAATGAGDDDLLGLFDGDSAAAVPARPVSAASPPVAAATGAGHHERVSPQSAAPPALEAADSFNPRDDDVSSSAAAAGPGAATGDAADDPFDPRGGDSAPPPLATAASDSSFDPRGDGAAATAPAPAAADDVDAFEAYLAEQDAAS